MRHCIDLRPTPPRALLTLLTALATVGCGAPEDASPPEDPRATPTDGPRSLADRDAEHVLRASLGEDEADAVIVGATALRFPDSGLEAYMGVVEDPETGAARKVVLDADGHETSVPELFAREHEATRARRGVLDERAWRLLHSAAPDDVVEVLAHYETPTVDKPEALYDPGASREAIEATMAEVEGTRAALAADARQQVEAAMLARGAELLPRNPRAASDPTAVALRLPIADLDAFADPDYLGPVVAISLPVDESTIQPLDFFYDSDDHETKETFVDAGIDGDGTKVGIIEMVGGCGLWYSNNGGNVQPTPFWNWSGYTQEAPSAVKGCDTKEEGAACDGGCNNAGVGTCRQGRCVATHPTTVASHVGAHYTGCTTNCNGGGSDRGAAATHIYFAQSSPYMSQRLGWFASNGVRVFNHSETPAGTNAVNWAIRNHWMTGTHAAGNDANSTVDCYANALCVGAARPTGVGVVDRWKTDPSDLTDAYRVVGGFSYGNGIQGRSFADVEKPDVVAIDNAPGVNPQSGTWVNAGGTSFAAPAVAGMVALLQDRYPFTAVWPELTRPLIMASAVSHNVEGNQLSRNDGADDRDGAGMPVMSVLESIMDNGWFQMGHWTPSSFSEGWATGPSVTLQPGEGLRVVLGWMHCVQSNNDGSNGELIAADFDLYLEDSGGNTLRYSTSSNNSLEMLEYDNTSGAPRTVVVRTHQYGSWQACGGSQSEYYGLAWAKHTDFAVD